MKYLLLISTISIFITSCSKDFSYEGVPLQPNTIENETDGLTFFLHTKGAEVSINIYLGAMSVPVTEVNKYYEYAVSSGDLQDNLEYTIELQYYSVPTSGTLDIMVEGFTAMGGTKTYWLRNIPINVNDSGTKKKVLKMTRSGFRYTFTPY